MISVIVIIKDTRDYLKKCLDSVRNQSFRNLQVIVVDDHSYKSSDDIVAEYKSVLDIAYYYLEEDAGPGGARNFGLQYATGEYICFLDSDDWIDLDYLSAVEEIMSNYQADIGMCGLVRNYNSPSYKPVYKCQYTRVHTMNGTTAFRILSGQYDFGVIVSPSPVNKVYRRDLLERNNIRFLEHVYYEDVLFAFQTLLTDCRVVTIPDVYYHHYRRSGSIVQSLTKRHFDDFETVFTNVKSYLIASGLYGEYIFNYYKVLERFYNLLIRQVFQFSSGELEKKHWMRYSFSALKEVIDIDEYIEYSSAEDIRRHLQPYITDTTLY